MFINVLQWKCPEFGQLFRVLFFEKIIYTLYDNITPVVLMYRDVKQKLSITLRDRVTG